jgi:transcriptional regulator with PAS, ATPase and Fis domain
MGMREGNITEQVSTGSPRAPHTPELLIVHSPDPAWSGRRVALTEDVTFGREPAGGVTAIADRRASRRHLSVHVGRGAPAVFVEDHDSTNGTYVEGRRVTSERLEDGMVLRFGDTVCLLEERPGGAAPDAPDPLIVGESREVRVLRGDLARVAVSDLSVLLLGETGTGKELAAQRIHELSGRRGRLLCLNCGAIPEPLIEAALFGHRKGAFTGAVDSTEGYFLAADRGTLFLDEIGELPLALQPRLLRVLDGGSFNSVGSTSPIKADVRIIAATNANLLERVEDGEFRRDLYARLCEFVVELPPLRRRRGDIMPLFEHFLRLAAPAKTFVLTGDFVEALLGHSWPMNVRELRSLARRVALSDTDPTTLDATLLPLDLRPRRRPDLVGTECPSREDLETQLERHKGNLLRVARHYGKARSQVYRWLKRLELDAENYR